MKTKVILSMLAIFAVSVFAQPKLFIDNKVFDWGTVQEGTEKIKHTFVAVNKGTDTLKISNIRTSCGCTVAKYDTIIAPGKTANITAEFNKSGRTGPQERTLTVYSNDVEFPQFQLTIKGHIKTVLDITPRWLQLYSNKGKVNGSVLFTTENKNLQITKAQYAVANNGENNGKNGINVAFTLKHKSKPNEKGEITYEFGFNFVKNVDNHENGSITFDTNIKERPAITMNVSIEPQKDAPY